MYPFYSAKSFELFSVPGTQFSEKDYCPISLSVYDSNAAAVDLTTFEGLSRYVRKTLEKNNAKIAFGGYGERRAIYTQSAHFNDTDDPRCIHLGIDFWTAAHTPIYAPLDGKIHSFRYNDQPLDYGATIITEHTHDSKIFWLLFGHLSLTSLKNLEVGQTVNRGDKLATLGEPHENGGWVPHLHLQCIMELGDWVGDFPGVATVSEAAHYLRICPSPLEL